MVQSQEPVGLKIIGCKIGWAANICRFIDP